MKLNLGGIIPLSTNEYKDNVSVVIFFNGCIFKCPYCHNHEMINAVNYIDIDIVKDKIRESKPFINSAAFTGGEPTMQPEALKELLIFSKNIGLKTLVETNGYYPNILKELVNCGLIDEIYIDIKTTKSEYTKITGKEDAYDRMIESINISVPMVKRTTVFKNFQVPKCSDVLQRGLVGLSKDKTLDEFTIEEFERLLHSRK